MNLDVDLDKKPTMWILELTRTKIDDFGRFKNLEAYWKEKRHTCIDLRNVPAISDFIQECSEHLENFPSDELVPLAEQGNPEAIVEMGMRYVDTTPLITHCY